MRFSGYTDDEFRALLKVQERLLFADDLRTIGAALAIAEHEAVVALCDGDRARQTVALLASALHAAKRGKWTASSLAAASAIELLGGLQVDEAGEALGKGGPT